MHAFHGDPCAQSKPGDRLHHTENGMGPLHPSVADGDCHHASEHQLLRNGKLSKGAKDPAQPSVACRALWNQSTVGKAELAEKGPETTAFIVTHRCLWLSCLCEFVHTALILAAP